MLEHGEQAAIATFSHSSLSSSGLPSRAHPRALFISADESKGTRRIVIEKPFGTDLKTARELNETVHAVFSERQVYRIDHYLGKETVQNILVLR